MAPLANSIGEPIESVEQLIALFSLGCKPKQSFRIGTELEALGVQAKTGMPLCYQGQGGIEHALCWIQEHAGWEPILEGEALIGLRNASGASISLEPGGQTELSGAPLKTLAETKHELTEYVNFLQTFGSRWSAAWMGLGFRPYGGLDDVPWMPKGRYRIMRDYLGKKGRLAHEMMKRTATVQANLDFCSEQDAKDKMELALRASALTTALFANSSIVDGRITDYESYRAQVWLEMDNDRCGLLPFVFEPGNFFTQYTMWLLDVPMFFIIRGDQYIPMHGMPFSEFLQKGKDGEAATFADWALHQSTVFPQARLKNFLEMRSSDSGSLEFALALPAYWKGLLYDNDSLGEALALLRPLSLSQLLDMERAVPKAGLELPVPGLGPARDVLGKLLQLADGALMKQSKAEHEFLAPLHRVVDSGKTQAMQLREDWSKLAAHAPDFVASYQLSGESTPF